MKRLEKSRIIRGYHAEIDLGRLAKLSTFVVQIKLTDYSYARAKVFEAGIADLPNVIGCQAVLGDVDYLITIAAFGIEHYQTIMEHMLDTLNVSFDYVTLPVTKKLKGKRGIGTTPPGVEVFDIGNQRKLNTTRVAEELKAMRSSRRVIKGRPMTRPSGSAVIGKVLKSASDWSGV